MNFSEFCQPFHGASKSACGIKGKTSQAALAEFFMVAALNDRAKIDLSFSDDTFRKWFKGERSPQPELWGTISSCFDDVFFSRIVSANINERVLPSLIESFGIILSEEDVPDKYALSGALAKQFKAIADGCGEADNIIKEAYIDYLAIDNFPDYIKNSQKKYSKMKTLLYSSEERPFYDFFVCNMISTHPRRFYGAHRNMPEGITIENATLNKLAEKSKCVLLVGMGGIGKSMMMRHLFLESINQYKKTGFLPILVTLREFGSENNDFFNLIVDSVHRFDITFSAAHVHKLMGEGKCQLLLDGLDEIKASDLEAFESQLDAMIDRYPLNQFVMSTRKFDSFIGLSRFTMMWMKPFTHAQALELIDKLEFCPEEPRLKQKFRDQLETSLFKSHAEFVTNPLLLTLMLMNYHRFAEVPEKKYLFYEQAYETLLYRHDADKLAYKRVFRSVTDPSSFTKVFREFCAKSYRHGDYEFDSDLFEEYFNKLKSVERLHSDIMTKDNFLFDVCNSACLMYEESRSYHFLHRSFQEYFFADYYSRQDDNTLRRLGKAIDKTDQMLFDDSPAFDMLYDLAPEKVEQFIILPYLDKIYSENNEQNGYWKFLINGYERFDYIIMDEEQISNLEPMEHFRINRNSNIPSSEILSLLYRILGIEGQFNLPIKGKKFEYQDLIEGIIVAGNKENRPTFPLMQIPIKMLEDEAERKAPIFERAARDDSGKIIEYGHIYVFDFSLALQQDIKEKYPAIIEIWNSASCPAYKNYRAIKKYYDTLCSKYNKTAEEEDDDF